MSNHLLVVGLAQIEHGPRLEVQETHQVVVLNVALIVFIQPVKIVFLKAEIYFGVKQLNSAL